ncbi:MAG: PIN domain nuclease [Burkholderiales bacterium]|nr:PIN domain nuclease [Burkholderiales bacterium]
MILVDSSVWIDYFRGTTSDEANRLDSMLDSERIVVGDIILAEVLRGFSVDKHFNDARRLLLRLEQTSLGGTELAVDAATKCRFLRARGITVRGTVDALIATYCMRHEVALLTRDRDFLPFAEHFGLMLA